MNILWYRENLPTLPSMIFVISMHHPYIMIVH